MKSAFAGYQCRSKVTEDSRVCGTKLRVAKKKPTAGNSKKVIYRVHSELNKRDEDLLLTKKANLIGL